MKNLENRSNTPTSTKINTTMENKKVTQFTKNQQYQLQALRESAAELMAETHEMPFNDAFESTLVKLQQKYPLVLPMLLLESMYNFIENNDHYDAATKAEARSSRKECKDWRADLYRDMDLTFNV